MSWLLALTLCVSGCGLTTATPFPPSPEPSTPVVTTPSEPVSGLTKDAFLAAAVTGLDRAGVVAALGRPDIENEAVMLYALREPAGAYGAVVLSDGKATEVGVW